MLYLHLRPTAKPIRPIVPHYDCENHNDIDPSTCFYVNAQERSYPDSDPPITVNLNDPTCHVDPNSLTRTCEGIIDWASPRDTKWHATIGYECANTTYPPLDISYEISVIEHESITCWEEHNLVNEFECDVKSELQLIASEYYNSFSLYNTFGFTPKLEAKGLRSPVNCQ